MTAGSVCGHGEVIGPRVVRWYKAAAWYELDRNIRWYKAAAAAWIVTITSSLININNSFICNLYIKFLNFLLN